MGLNRNEKSILRAAIKTVSHPPWNSHAWEELKHQIFDYGYQKYYPAQGEFDIHAKNEIARLSEQEKEDLLTEWRNAKPPRSEMSDSEILAYYAHQIVEEIVIRARAASARSFFY